MHSLCNFLGKLYSKSKTDYVQFKKVLNDFDLYLEKIIITVLIRFVILFHI